MLRLTCLALLLPAAATAQDASEAAAAFRDRPCAEVLEVLYMEEAGGSDLAQVFEAVGRRGLYLGIVAGFDLAHGGLGGEAPSTLARLREACASDPDVPALTLLEGFAAD
jgi:hypothetical protein